MRVSILTISDSVAAGTSEDRSGPSVIDRCRELGWRIVSSAVRADDRAAIEHFLKEAADSNDADLILTTGGTGLGPRDITPEATAAVVERMIPGFSEQMRAAGAEKTPRAVLSRGSRGNSRKNHHHQSARQPEGRRGIARRHRRSSSSRRRGSSRRAPRALVRGPRPACIPCSFCVKLARGFGETQSRSAIIDYFQTEEKSE